MVFSFKNLLQGTLSNVGLKVPGSNVGGKQGFPRTLNKSSLWADTGSDIAVVASKWVRIGEYNIPAQQVIHLGQGVSQGNPEEIGHLQFDIVDDTATNSAEEKGYIRVGMVNAGENIQYFAIEERSELLHNITTRASQLLFPERVDFIPKELVSLLTGENSKIVIDFKADAGDTIVETGIGTGALNTWQLPVTVYQ